MKIKQGKDYYQLLGIHPESSIDEIKNAYRELARMYHPDAISSTSNKNILPDPDIFKSITEAYALLSNPEKRKEYDYYLSQNRPESSIHWLKGGKPGEVPLKSRNAPPPSSSQASRAWREHKKLSRNDESRYRLFIVSFLGVIVGITAAILVFLLIKVLFLN